MKQRLYLDELPKPPASAERYTREQLEGLRPYALVYKGPNWRVVRNSTTGWVVRSGLLIAELVQNVPAGEEFLSARADRDFDNTVGQMLSTGDTTKPGLAELLATSPATTLQWNEVEIDGPWWSDEEKEDQQGIFQTYMVGITVGVT